MKRLLALVALLLVAAVAWVGVRGYLARGHLDDAAGRLSTFEQELGDLDIDGARSTLAQVRSDTAAARGLTSDGVWRVVGTFPWGGQNLRAVGTGTATVDDLAGDALVALVDAGAGYVAVRDGLAAGRLDAGGLLDAAAGVARLQASVTQAREDLHAIDRDYLLEPVEAALAELESSLDLAQRAGDLLTSRLAPT